MKISGTPKTYLGEIKVTFEEQRLVALLQGSVESDDSSASLRW